MANYVWVDDTGDYLLLRPEHVLQEWERYILAACVDDFGFARVSPTMGWGVPPWAITGGRETLKDLVALVTLGASLEEAFGICVIDRQIGELTEAIQVLRCLHGPGFSECILLISQELAPKGFRRIFEGLLLRDDGTMAHGFAEARDWEEIAGTPIYESYRWTEMSPTRQASALVLRLAVGAVWHATPTRQLGQAWPLVGERNMRRGWRGPRTSSAEELRGRVRLAKLRAVSAEPRLEASPDEDDGENDAE